MPYTTLFFDLDDTLYSSTCGLWEAIKDRMVLYMTDVLHIPPEQVPSLRHHYYTTYGTTLRGLQQHYGVNADDFLGYVHDLPLKQYIHADARVRPLIASLPQPKWIFTNADEPHAGRVLDQLDLNGLFDGIIDIRRSNWVCKPEPAAYRQAMEIAGETDPTRCVMLDDSARNLAPAHELGFTTIIVSLEDPGTKDHIWLRSILELREKAPLLWGDDCRN